MDKQIKKLMDMLRYKRPEGSSTQRLFCKKFLEPVFGEPDEHGNYILIIGERPNIAFMSHHDTVHTTQGYQFVWENKGFLYSNSNCLGADCTTGVWLMLGMIEAGVEGVYIVHAGEECGCLGSRALVKDFPDWLEDVDFAISFDRYGTESVITHQMGFRTASEDFAESFADAVNVPLWSDSGGSYTDSNEYADIVSECTNISVGYDRQHTTYESQDIEFAKTMMYALCTADWSKLVKSRDPDERDFSFGMSHWGNDWGSTIERTGRPETLQDLIELYPHRVAALFHSWGFETEELEAQLFPVGRPNKKVM